MITLLIALVLFFTLELFVGSPSIINLNAYVGIVIAVYVTINVFYFLKYKKGQDIFCAELLFSISFFLASFLLYFFLPLLDTWQSRIYVADSDVIFKAYTISIIGYLMYMLGLIVKKPMTNDEAFIKFHFNGSFINIAVLLCSFFIVLFFLNDGIKMLSMYDSNYNTGWENRFEEIGSLLTYSTITFIISTFAISSLGNIKLIVKRPISWIYMFNLVVLFFITLFSGYRSGLLQLVIPVIIAYSNNIKKLNGSKVMAILIAGMILMVAARYTRSGQTFNRESATWFTYVSDFTPANASLTFMIDYVDKNGSAHGSNMLYQLFSVIPFMQGILSKTGLIGSAAPTSSSFYTSYFDSYSGLGTGIISDLYYSFGSIGVYVLMFVMGFFVKKITHFRTPYGYLMLLVFAGNAIFASRVEYLYIVRTLSFSVIFFWLISLVAGKPTITYTKQ